MADATYNDRLKDFILAQGINEQDYEAKKNELTWLDTYTKLFDTVETLRNSPEHINDLMPNELVSLNNNLKIRIEKNLYKGEGITNEEVNKILESIQKTIDAKVADYAENKIDIDIDDASSMGELLKTQTATNDEKIKEQNAKAKNRLNAFVKDYDEQNGLTGLTPNDANLINANMEKLETLNTNIFEYANLAEQSTEPNKTPPLKNQNFQGIFDILKNVEIEGDLKLLGHEKIEQFDKDGNIKPDSEMALFVESIVNKTKEVMAVSKEPFDQATFDENLKANLEIGLAELYLADNVTKGKSSQKDIEAAIATLSKMQEGGQKITISRDTMVGYQAAKNKEAESFRKRLESKVGKISAIAKMRNNAETLDKKLEAKHGKKYTETKKFLKMSAKVAFKAAAWGTAFGVASTIGAPAVAAIAVTSMANQMWGMKKDYKKQKAEALEKGQKLSFFGYMKKNKMRCAGVVLAAVATAVPGMQCLGGETLQAIASSPLTQQARAISGMTLAAGNGLKSAAQTYKETKSLKKALFSFGNAGVMFGVGYLAGQSAGGMAGEAIAEYQSTTNEANTLVDIDGDKIPDTIDREITDNSATEIKIEELSKEDVYKNDMLTKQAPNLVGSALGVEGNHTSAEMAEIVKNIESNGTPEQRAVLDNLREGVDSRGNLSADLKAQAETFNPKPVNNTTPAENISPVEEARPEPMQTIINEEIQIIPTLQVEVNVEESINKLQDQLDANREHITEDVKDLTDADKRSERVEAREHLKDEHGFTQEQIKDIEKADRINDRHERADEKLENKIERLEARHENKFHQNDIKPEEATAPVEEIKETPVTKPELTEAEKAAIVSAKAAGIDPNTTGADNLNNVLKSDVSYQKAYFNPETGERHVMTIHKDGSVDNKSFDKDLNEIPNEPKTDRISNLRGTEQRSTTNTNVIKTTINTNIVDKGNTK